MPNTFIELCKTARRIAASEFPNAIFAPDASESECSFSARGRRCVWRHSDGTLSIYFLQRYQNADERGRDLCYELSNGEAVFTGDSSQASLEEIARDSLRFLEEPDEKEYDG